MAGTDNFTEREARDVVARSARVLRSWEHELAVLYDEDSEDADYSGGAVATILSTLRDIERDFPALKKEARAVIERYRKFSYVDRR
ncbi:hypothetical protein EMQ25_11450 [Arsenicitalea aurantiaca]|uniref:Uncharacterized protein n=1 Tax=Arsenicitalea aurantiaca TaxID=1783274 RepID=A0A433X748_9HYPH|nr:hypothetical protein [Arsenicitalea aurantiaca]RUT29951.1 hypothetical protein EMQ25_11450 [Arsenicitalea aurantiaca]